MGTKSKDHFAAALEKLNEAKKELFRPEEDIVSYLVCKNSQHAIENYLKGYHFDSETTEFKLFNNFYNNEIKKRNLIFHDAEKMIFSKMDFRLSTTA